MVNEKGEVNQVRYMICIVVDGKEKLLTPKLDSLRKHVSHHKAKVSIPIMMLVHITWTKIICMPRMNNNTKLVNALLLWTYSIVMYLLITNRNMFKFPLFFTFLFMAILWLILRVSKHCNKCCLWIMFPKNIGFLETLNSSNWGIANVTTRGFFFGECE